MYQLMNTLKIPTNNFDEVYLAIPGTSQAATVPAPANDQAATIPTVEIFWMKILAAFIKGFGFSIYKASYIITSHIPIQSFLKCWKYRNINDIKMVVCFTLLVYSFRYLWTALVFVDLLILRMLPDNCHQHHLK